MDAQDAATLALATHEAAHLTAATAVGMAWEHATIIPTGNMAGHVLFHHSPVDPALQAFVYWAGPAAEARVTGTKLSTALHGFSASHDLPVFAPYYSGRAAKVWTSVLDSLWPAIQESTLRLLLLGTIKPNTVDPLQDPLNDRRHGVEPIAASLASAPVTTPP